MSVLIYIEDCSQAFSSSAKTIPEKRIRPLATNINFNDFNPLQISFRVLNALFIFQSYLS